VRSNQDLFTFEPSAAVDRGICEKNTQASHSGLCLLWFSGIPLCIQSINVRTLFRLRRPNTLFVGQSMVDLPEVPSTNAYAQALLSESRPPAGTVVTTFHQTAGRGQIGSHWESEPGKNISLSAIFRPDFIEAKDQFQLNQCISLAVLDLVKNCLPDQPVSIKWPNDIYVGSRKIAGILIQNSLINTQIRSTVAGIGININQTRFASNPPNPTSLRLESGHDFPLDDLVPLLCEHLERRYLQLKAGKIVPLQHDYLRHLYRFGQLANYQRTSGPTGASEPVFQGTITGIDEMGRLRVEVDSRIECFDLKEIRFI
jgi:BirA family transcriptional regulator, biotin operon repressor / biotin---[acetyl-CoA-carboxylase] ligase